VGVLVCEESRFGDGVHQREAKERRRGAACLGGGTRRDLFFLDPQRSQQRRRILLDHRSSLLEQRITGIRCEEPRGVHFHLITHTSNDRRLMTLRAGISIEQWAEAILRFEDSLENFLPL